MTPTRILPAVLVLFVAAATAGEPDWFTRVKEQGLAPACETEVARYERGALTASHHVGECYFELGRYKEGIEVFRRLLRSSDENYAAAARARIGEGLYHLDRPGEARAEFEGCLEQHPEAWFDGSVAERCRAWLEKLAGRLVSPEKAKAEAEAKAEPDLEELRGEIRGLTERLEELKRLLRELTEEGER